MAFGAGGMGGSLGEGLRPNVGAGSGAGASDSGALRMPDSRGFGPGGFGSGGLINPENVWRMRGAMQALGAMNMGRGNPVSGFGSMGQMQGGGAPQVGPKPGGGLLAGVPGMGSGMAGRAAQGALGGIGGSPNLLWSSNPRGRAKGVLMGGG